MSNPQTPQNPGNPHQNGQSTPLDSTVHGHNGVPQSASQQWAPQQWAPQYAGSAPYPGGANSAGPGQPGAGAYPPAGPGYPGTQQNYGGAGHGQKPPKRKKPLLKRWWFWLIVIIVVIALINAISGGGEATEEASDVASTQEDTAGGKDTDEKTKSDGETAGYGIGDEVASDGWEVTVVKVEDGVSSLGNEYLGTEAQGQFVKVSLSVKNTESDPDYFFEDNIKLGDDKGNTYSADSEAGIYADEDSILFLEEINPGNTAKGVLVFDVPKDVSPDRLTFEGGIFSDPVEISLQ